MREFCLTVVIDMEAYREAALDELVRAVWVTMVAILTLDARALAVANKQLETAFFRSLLIERLIKSPVS